MLQCVKLSDLRKWGTKADRFAYKRLKNGLKYQEKLGKKIRFLTLTGVCSGKGYRSNFQKLRKWIRQKSGEFEYFLVRTGEGVIGVIHCLFAGKSIRLSEIRKFWKGISGFWNVSISRVYEFSTIMIEMTRQNKVVRYSQSRGWWPWKKLLEKELCGNQNSVLNVV